MILNNTPISASLSDILYELRNQLLANDIHLLKDIKDTSDNIMVTCPYHKNGQERRPSAGIQKETGMFHCFTCGEVHTLQEVISFCFGHGDDVVGVWGWNWILKNFLTVSVEERKDVSLDYSRDPVRVVKPSVSEEELDKYRVYHPYMWKRKMTPEVVELFDIGFDSQTQSITFPVRDQDGRCLFVARRSVKTKFFNYPKNVEKPVYGLYEYTCTRDQVYKDVCMLRAPASMLDWCNEVIICESMIDAITCWVYGKLAVALNGLGSETQIQQLKAMPCRKFILATDNDEYGKKARVRLRKVLRGKIITEYIFPDGKKDINDLSKEEFDNLKEVFC